MNCKKPEIPILSIPFSALTEPETLALILSFLDEPRNHIITTPNPEAVMQARRNAEFYDALMAADLRLADGIGILLASRLLKNARLPGRVRGVDTCRASFKALLEKKRPTTAYFLGGEPGVAEAAKIETEKLYPVIKVVGFNDGFLNPEKEKLIEQEIRTKKPEILLVCMGMPRQELWAAKHKDLPVRLTLCLGGTLDILAGKVKLTPEWIRKIGLEWLHRLLRQPSRAKRMLDLPRFMFAVMRER
jgi:N-acetylglucosaminyldiphosphoundecaprenol N-acetyl-beta-D-mannosaminyltransferase